MRSFRWRLVGILMVLGLLVPAQTRAGQSPDTTLPTISFTLAPASPAIAACLPGVQAHGTIAPNAQNEALTLHATGLPPFGAFDLYLTARPRAPYGIAWPLSMLQADALGTADVQVQTALLQTAAISGTSMPASHLVLFFDNPRDADQCFGAGGAPTTPYNAAHQAGPAVLATVGYPDASGPLQAPALARPGLGFNVPALGRSAPGQAVIFTTTCSHPAGWKAIRFIDFRLTQGGVVRFWARLDRLNKRLYLYNPATHRWSRGQVPGSKSVLSSPLTQLIVTDSTVVGTTGTTGKMIWGIVFTQAAHGQTFQQSVQVTDVRYQSSGWNPTGSWSVD